MQRHVSGESMARPTQFDRTEVLDKAMLAFWRQGYSATSMVDLVETTHLKPGSLYAAFESKKALFLTTLDRYGAESEHNLRQHLDKASSPVAAIGEYFDELADIVERDTDKSSCFLVNTVLELCRSDHEVRKHINGHLERVESIFLTALQRAQEKREIGSNADCEALAAFLMNNIWGLRVLAGTQPPQGKARQVVNFVKQVLKQ